MPDFKYVPMGKMGFTLQPTFETPHDFLLYTMRLNKIGILWKVLHGKKFA